MILRVFNMDDYKAVYDLWMRTPGMGLNDIDDSEEGINRFFTRNPNTCFVAEEGGKLIGVIFCGHDGRRGYIYHTCVAVEFRKAGLGRELVMSAMEALRGEGISKVALVVFERNEIGNHFWEQLGFETRSDLIYRNRALVELERIDT
ncbi:MAG: GNAT family N-acetyltransferase [Tissierellia bacterium]|nr:GNAT family N-acetyltransferase [Tissierellia bacterium]